IDPKCLVIIGDGPIKVSLGSPGGATIAICFNKARVDRDGLAVAFYGVYKVVLEKKHVAAGTVGRCISRVNANGDLKIGHRPVHISLGVTDEAPVVIGNRPVWSECNGYIIVGQSLVKFTPGI